VNSVKFITDQISNGSHNPKSNLASWSRSKSSRAAEDWMLASFLCKYSYSFREFVLLTTDVFCFFVRTNDGSGDSASLNNPSIFISENCSFCLILLLGDLPIWSLSFLKSIDESPADLSVFPNSRANSTPFDL
jgi:hypothetical protein